MGTIASKEICPLERGFRPNRRRRISRFSIATMRTSISMAGLAWEYRLCSFLAS